MLNPEGGKRFTLQRRIGEGGMGIVYLARDEARGCDVALKTLPRVSAENLYRFKREFRALADLSHPNLVALHDLVCDNDNWCLTMDYVEGESFLDYVLHDDGPRCGQASERRLRHAVAQLVEAIMVLHEAGKLHRDLKPSNVLVTRDERVVVLDFGLVDEFGDGHASLTEAGLMGTPAYLAPEQATGAGACAASDWYALGSMLYEAMTGRLPFEGGALQILLAKSRTPPEPASRHASGISPALDELCLDLLALDPAARPTGELILARLTGTPRSVSHSLPPPSASSSSTMEFTGDHSFIGRVAEREELARALRTAREGRGVVVHLQGPSGMGKSAVAKRFLRDIEAEQGVTVLYGRCYERESLPYKALDSVVDHLTRYLRRLSASELKQVLPAHIDALARVFPVLRRVDGIARLTRGTSVAPSIAVAELRARAQRALKELLTNLRRRTMLVICIDDLQWGDVDSADFLLELMGPPAPPAILLLVTFRSEEVTESACLKRFLALEHAPAQAAERVHLTIGPLTRDDALKLALSLLGPDQLDARVLAQGIADECSGHPFFLEELTRHCLERGAATSGTSLEQVLLARFAALAPPARRLLDVLAVASRPIPERIALRTAGLVAGDTSALRSLRQGKLVRARRSKKTALVETYHDRVRETALAHLEPEEQRALHGALAVELELQSDTPPEWLFEHFRRAGDAKRAGEHAERAAEHAEAALAYRRAAELHAAALELCPDVARRGELERKLAQALANAGQEVAAARAFIAVAAREPPRAALLLRGRAASQLLQAGRTAEGLSLAREVVVALGVRWPDSLLTALLRFIIDRILVRFVYRPLEVEPRDDVPERERETLYVLALLFGQLASTDFLRAHAVVVQLLERARRVGDRSSLSTYLAFDSIVQSSPGTAASYQRAERLHARAAKLCEPLPVATSLGSPHVGLLYARSACAFWAGHWNESRKYAIELETMCAELPWERQTLGMATALRLGNLFFTGELTELAAGLSPALRQARATDQKACLPQLLSAAGLSQLSQDNVEGAEAAVREAQSIAVTLQAELADHIVANVKMHIARYREDAQSARDLVHEEWSRVLPSGLRRIRYFRDVALSHRASANLMLAKDDAHPGRLLRSAAADGRELKESPLSFGRLAGHLVLAAWETQKARRDHAARHLEAAHSIAKAAGMLAFAEVARFRLGELRGPMEGRGLTEQAHDELQTLGVRTPLRFVHWMAPGFRL